MRLNEVTLRGIEVNEVTLRGVEVKWCYFERE